MNFRALSTLGIALALALPLAAQEPASVVFSELMWMGSSASSADEWIELFNSSEAEVDLSGWTLTRSTSAGEQTMLRIEQGRIAPQGTFLIANYAPEDERSMLAVQPQLVDAAVSLANARLQLKLYDGDPEQGGRLIDTADDGRGAPLAGDAEFKYAMVRIAFDQDGTLASSWSTAQEASGWDPEALERGTPGRIPARLLSDPSRSTTSTAVAPTAWARVKAGALGAE